ncbi:MAG: ABC transporter ATP-binding protein [Desulfarculaceae bacterium]|nr:ABC transporter ATP-binding protein [Desulfarculaceae bacterium]MCF8074284.1 ABC transporter ATP-binding protein [Desulfarculaceae bacterium]MCF8103352.1 ABC transporter ATP-binding protein [Desulfarculaceae bacterium]MCF8117858.1 ABC transporter ATP-binding protein [Desulfarculaceae bacterium]
MAILETKHVTKNFGGLTALQDVSFALEKGEVMGLIGPNGAGKTTLINILSGAFHPSEGKVIYQGEDISRLKANLVNERGIARTFQVVRIFKRLTVLENVLTAMVDRGKDGPWRLVWGSFFRRACAFNQDRDACATADGLLASVGLLDYRDERAENLPYAMSKRLEIARALATRPKVLLLDEPSSGLNPAEQNEQIKIIRQINEQGISILIIEHVMKVIMDISHRLIVLHYGEKIAEGEPEAVYNDPLVVEAYLGGEGNA